MSESRIVVVEQTQCEHGNYGWHGNLIDHPSDPFCPGGGSRIIDPGNLPAEVIATVAAVLCTERAIRPCHFHQEQARAALSAAFRTLGEINGV